MKFTDAASVTGTRKTADGYLVADAFAVRTGIQLYAGSEVGKPDVPVVRVYRSEDQVRSAESLQSFSHAPVTMLHPKEQVTADNWKQLAVGEVSTEAAWQDGKIKLPLILKDAATIAAVEAGTRELSAGYTCSLRFVDGVTEDGQAYDAVQENIRANHLAIVPRGRAGSEFRIGDGAVEWGAAPITMSDKEGNMSDALMTVVLGDKAVKVAATDHAAIEAYKADMATKLADAEAKTKEAEDDRDKKVAKAEADKDAAEAKVVKADALDKLVQDRADLIAQAKSIVADVKTAGLNDAAIRKAVVVAKLGDAIKDKSDAYIDARFDILAEDAGKKSDPVRDAVMQRDGQTITVGDVAAEAEKAYQDRLAEMRDAYKGGAK